MGRIPDEYLPPEDLRPTRIRTIPEVQAYPNRMNPTSELLDRQVEQGRGGRPAIRFQDRVITYAGLQEQANGLGIVLAARGVEEEDRVVILSPNQPLSVAANFAVMKLGAIPVPASPLLSPPEIAWVLNNSEADVLFSPAPLAFAAGYGAMAIIPFRFGAAVSLMPRFEPEAAFQAVEQHHATVLTILPTSYRKMLQVPDASKRFDLSAVRLCTGGGEALTADTYHRWQDRFGLEIFEGFGTTEMLYVFVSAVVTERARPGSFGTAVPGYEVKIVDDQGNELAPGELGRMVARGPTGTMYWRPLEEDARLMASQRQAVVGEGWNLVGDYAQTDQDGYFWFVSREDDLIKSSGYRIGPDEVEMAIATHPAVADVGVI